jgi:transcriptional regulator with XRE-family HTH domain
LSHSLTQEAFANLIKVSPPYVSQLERDRRIPSDTVCVAIADVLPEAFEVAELFDETRRLRNPATASLIPFRGATEEATNRHPLIEKLLRKLRTMAPKEVETLTERWFRDISLAEMLQKKRRTHKK